MLSNQRAEVVLFPASNKVHSFQRPSSLAVESQSIGMFGGECGSTDPLSQ